MVRVYGARFLAVLVAAAALAMPRGATATAVSEANCATRADSRVRAMNDTGIELTSALGLAAGRYALPTDPNPTQLVVMFHGHGNDSCGWRKHLQDVAAKGAVAVAMDYTGQRDNPTEDYGWFVKEGAADSIAAAKHFLAEFPSITNVIAFGVSMGGNASGVAVASPDAVRADGSPLFNEWIDIEGVNNLTEEYSIVRAIAPANASGAQAKAEIEEEAGGPIESVPSAYAALTNTTNAPLMKGLKAAVVVQGLDDGLVPTNQSREMTTALNAVGVPTHQYTVVLKGSGDSGTTASAIAAGPIFAGAGQGTYSSPFAGHGWEGSDTQLVIKTGLDQLYALLDGATVTTGETVVAGN